MDQQESAPNLPWAVNLPPAQQPARPRQVQEAPPNPYQEPYFQPAPTPYTSSSSSSSAAQPLGMSLDSGQAVSGMPSTFDHRHRYTHGPEHGQHTVFQASLGNPYHMGIAQSQHERGPYHPGTPQGYPQAPASHHSQNMPPYPHRPYARPEPTDLHQQQSGNQSTTPGLPQVPLYTLPPGIDSTGPDHLYGNPSEPTTFYNPQLGPSSLNSSRLGQDQRSWQQAQPVPASSPYAYQQYPQPQQQVGGFSWPMAPLQQPSIHVPAHQESPLAIQTVDLPPTWLAAVSEEPSASASASSSALASPRTNAATLAGPPRAAGPSKRHIAQSACETCRRKRTKCVIDSGQLACNVCKSLRVPCLFSGIDKRKESVRLLRTRLAQLEAIYGKLQTADSREVEALLNSIRRDVGGTALASLENTSSSSMPQVSSQGHDTVVSIKSQKKESSSSESPESGIGPLNEIRNNDENTKVGDEMKEMQLQEPAHYNDQGNTRRGRSGRQTNVPRQSHQTTIANEDTLTELTDR